MTCCRFDCAKVLTHYYESQNIGYLIPNWSLIPDDQLHVQLIPGSASKKTGHEWPTWFLPWKKLSWTTTSWRLNKWTLWVFFSWRLKLSFTLRDLAHTKKNPLAVEKDRTRFSVSNRPRGSHFFPCRLYALYYNSTISMAVARSIANTFFSFSVKKITHLP